MINVFGFLAFVYVAICVCLYFFQRTLIYFPHPVTDSGFANTTLMTLPMNETEVHVSVLPGEGTGAVIYFGGNAENVTYSVPDLATSLPDQALYLMHYRGFGGSGGKPTESGLFADALALFDKAQDKHEDITVVGRSLGSGVATYVASQRPVTRLVLVTPFDSILALARQQFAWLPVQWLLQDKFESSVYAPTITAPTLLIVAEHDEIIPLSSTKALLEFFQPGVAELKTIAGAGHNTISQSLEYRALLQGDK